MRLTDELNERQNVTAILAIERMDSDHYYAKLIVMGLGGGSTALSEVKICHTSAELHQLADTLVSHVFQISQSQKAEEVMQEKKKKKELPN